MPRRPRGWKVWVEPSGESWRCRWKGIYGTGQETFVRKPDAGDLRDATKADFQRRDAGLPSAPPAAAAPDYAAFRADVLAWYSRQRAGRTLYNTRVSLDWWEEFAGQAFPVLARRGPGKTIDQFADWALNVRAKRGGGKQGVNHVRLRLRHLKAAFRWGLKRDHLEVDPFLHFEMPPKVKVARLLTPDELSRLMAEMPDVCRRAMFFVLHTGLRIGEVLRLDWSGVSRGPTGIWYLTVVKSKTRRALGAETKTQAIHPRAVAVMGEPRKAGPVFDVKLSRLEQRLRAAVLKLGLGRARWHDVRHTWATYLMEEIKDLKALMDAGGWATVEAAMVYQHGTDKRRDATLQMPLQVPFQPLNTDSDGNQ